jgi:hypothetical protein
MISSFTKDSVPFVALSCKPMKVIFGGDTCTGVVDSQYLVVALKVKFPVVVVVLKVRFASVVVVFGK